MTKHKTASAVFDICHRRCGLRLEPRRSVLQSLKKLGARHKRPLGLWLLRAPQLAEKGEPGAEGWLALELKLVADVGIIGVPNAGKSTLLSVLSAARPKIADYPFTTLTPNLGVCEMDFTSTLFADIPGAVAPTG